MEYLSSICPMTGSSQSSFAVLPSLLDTSIFTPSSSSRWTASRCLTMTASIRTVLPNTLLAVGSADSSKSLWKTCILALTTARARGARWSMSTCLNKALPPWAILLLTMPARMSSASWSKACVSSPRFSAVTAGAVFFRLATPPAAAASCFLCVSFASDMAAVRGPFLGLVALLEAFPRVFLVAFGPAALPTPAPSTTFGGNLGSSMA
mmetsp:Transcript_63469/g.147922  ORF Transcript_63469/g.147922 Transcript_63469/m.147922 type:complete len:208 (-) Transcript_63469:1543-2166(-)